MIAIKTAFLSAYRKDFLPDLARELVEKGIELWASDGTARFLVSNDIPAKSVGELTGFSDLLGGRVKTLHPAVFSGILARPDDNDLSQVAEKGYPVFDIVFVDLYPFAESLGQKAFDEQIELIDIGGVALLRAAAKNCARVLPCFEPAQLQTAVEIMDESNSLPEDFVKGIAAETFFFISTYDSTIANWLISNPETDVKRKFPSHLSIGGKSHGELRYGENPHQKAAVFSTFPPEGIPAAEILGGKALSYNNYLDLDAALTGAIEFDEPSCTIVKHLSPCGIAIADDIVSAYEKALASDPLSAFGGIVALNKPVTPELAVIMKKHFFECIVAPEYEDDSLETLRKKKNLRLLRLPDLKPVNPTYLRGIAGGFVVQEINPPGVFSAKWEIMSNRKPTDFEEMELSFAMRATKLIKSNTVLIAKDKASVGIGGGLPSRVDAAILAVRKAGDRCRGAVAASDAFLPFPDTLHVLAEAGVTALIQPGGSRNDHLTIEAANELGVALVFTGMRHFRH